MFRRLTYFVLINTGDHTTEPLNPSIQQQDDEAILDLLLAR